MQCLNLLCLFLNCWASLRGLGFRSSCWNGWKSVCFPPLSPASELQIQFKCALLDKISLFWTPFLAWIHLVYKLNNGTDGREIYSAFNYKIYLD